MVPNQTDEEKAAEAAEKAAAAEAAKQAKLLSGKVVKYIGTADVREISAADWKSIGIEDQGKVVWDAKNKHSVPVSDLQPGALAYLQNDDVGFAVADADVNS